MDARQEAELKNLQGIKPLGNLSILETIYPVGSIYIGTMATCPLAAAGLGTWELVSSGRVLQGSDSAHSAGSTIEAGLPNITGTMSGYGDRDLFGTSDYSGALGVSGDGSNRITVVGESFNATGYPTFNFDASRSSSIYGNSTTVQPPAYVVNIWKRTA